MDEIMDTKVVQMKFDNAQFRAGVQDTIKQLETLENSLELKGASDGLDEVVRASKRTTGSMTDLSGAVDTVKLSFSYLEVAGITAMVKLTNAALVYGKRIADNLWSKSIGQIVSGGKRRSQNIANAKFQLEGLGVAWEDISEAVNYGVQDTAYGLDEAARAASQMVASMDMSQGYTHDMNEEMKRNLRAISGVAAMTNSSYSEIADIFTTVSSNGRLMTMQLRQLAARGLNASAILAEQMGKSEEEINKMVTRGQIGFRQFADIMDHEFGPHAKEANKTFQGALSNMNAALSRIGAKFADPVFENLRIIFNALKEDINNINSALQPAVDKFTQIANFVGKTAEKLLLNENFVKGLINVVLDLYSYVRPFIRAIEEMTGMQFGIETFAEKFNEIAESLQLYGDKAIYVKKVIKSIISGIDIFVYALASVVKMFKPVGTVIIEGFKNLFGVIDGGPDLIWKLNRPLKIVIDHITRFMSMNIEKVILAIGNAIKKINWENVAKAIIIITNITVAAINAIPKLLNVVRNVFRAIIIVIGAAAAAVAAFVALVMEGWEYVRDIVGGGLRIFSGATIAVRTQVDQASINQTREDIQTITSDPEPVTFDNNVQTWEDVTDAAEKAEESTKAAERQYGKTAAAAKSMANDVEKSYSRISKAASDSEYEQERAANSSRNTYSRTVEDVHEPDWQPKEYHEDTYRAPSGINAIANSAAKYFKDSRDKEKENTKSAIAEWFSGIIEAVRESGLYWTGRLYLAVQTISPVIALLAAIAVKVAQAVIIFKVIYRVFHAVFGIMEGIGEFFRSFNTMAKALYKQAVTGELRAVAAIISASTGAIIAVAAAVATFVAAAWVMKKYDLKDTAEYMYQLLKSMTIIVGIIIAIAASTKKYSSLVSVLKQLGVITISASKIGKPLVAQRPADTITSVITALAEVFLVLALDLAALVGAIKLLGSMSYTELAKGITAIGVISVVIMGMVYAIGQFGKDLGRYSMGWDGSTLTKKGLSVEKMAETSGTVIDKVLISLAGCIAVITAAIAVLGNLSPDALIQGGFTVAVIMGALIGFLYLMSKWFSKYSEAEDGAIDGKAYQTYIKNMSKGPDSPSLQAITKIMYGLAAYISAIAVAAAVLKDATPAQMGTMAGVLAVALGGLIGLMAVLAWNARQKVPDSAKLKSSYAGMMACILALSGFMMSFASAMLMLKGLSPGELIKGGIAILAGFALLTAFIAGTLAIIKGMNATSELVVLSGSIMALSAALSVILFSIAGTFKILQNIDWSAMEGSGKYLIGVGAFISLMTLIIVGCSAFTTGGTVIAVATGVALSMSVLLLAIASMFDIMGRIDWSFTSKAGPLLETVFVGISIITGIAALLGLFPEVGLVAIAAIGIMSAMFLALGSMFALIGVGVNFIGEGVGKLVEAIRTLMEDIEWSKANSVVIGLGQLVIGLSSVARLMSIDLLGNAIVFAAFIGLISYSIKSLAGIDPAVVQQVGESIGLFFSTIADSLTGKEEILNLMLQFANALPMIASSIAEALVNLAIGGVGLVAFAVEMLVFTTVMSMAGEGFGPGIEAVVNGIVYAGQAIANNVPGLMIGIGQLTLFSLGLIVIGTLLTAGGALMAAASLLILVSGATFGSAMKMLVDGIAFAGQYISANVAQLMIGFGQLMLFSVGLITVGTLLTAGGALIAAASLLIFISVAAISGSMVIFGKASETAMKSANNIATGFDTLIKKLYEIASDAAGLGTAFANAGIMITTGFINGIAQGTPSVVSSIGGLAGSVMSTFAGILGIHSPATEFIKMGVNVVAGFVQGIANGEPVSDAAMEAWATRTEGVFDVNLESDGENAVGTFMEGIQDMFEGMLPDMGEIWADGGSWLGGAFTTGLMNGMSDWDLSDQVTYSNRLGNNANGLDGTQANIAQIAHANATNTRRMWDDYHMNRLNADDYYTPPSSGGGAGDYTSDYTSDLASSISGSSGAGSGINDVSKSSSIGGGVGNTITNSNNTYNFVQNNYSPEALDRSAIYTQTRNQLNSYYRFNLETNLAK